MAELKIKYLATSVGMQMHFRVCLPDAALLDTDGPPLKVLWLLHPEGGDCTDFLRLTTVETHAARTDTALVMPNMDNSMYMDMAHGGYPYFTYLTDDLPAHARDVVRRLSRRPEDNTVAGIGTGGYGAVKWALRRPGMFSRCLCLSGDLDMAAALDAKAAGGALDSPWAAAFGSARDFAGSDHDILALAGATGTEAPCPVVAVSGAADTDAARNQRVVDRLRVAGLDVTVRHEPGSGDWTLWDAELHQFLGDGPGLVTEVA